MSTLRLASFGMRGLVGDSLTPDEMIRYALAFGNFIGGGDVVLGADTRRSSPMVVHAVHAALMSAGCRILDLGICPTPLIQFLVPHFGAAGGISISGGHNAMGWNSIGLIDSSGSFLEPLAGEGVLDAFHGMDVQNKDWHSIGRIEPMLDYAAPYFAALTRILDVDGIRVRKFKVLVDPIAGAGCRFLPAFAETLGVDCVVINGEASDYLPREPEPRPRSAKQMGSIVKPLGADAGFVFSSDLGRMSLVTEAGEPISEEYTFPILVNHVLKRNPGPVVSNCCSSRMTDDLCKRIQVPLLKSRVGPAFVMSMATDEGAVIAGEGSGSVSLPSFSPAFDGFLMMGLILEAMASGKSTLSALREDLPHYFITKRVHPFEPGMAYRGLDAVAETLMRQGRGALDLTDGVRMDWDDGWVHARVSRTEQLMRVISESEESGHARRRADDLERTLLQEI